MINEYYTTEYSGDLKTRHVRISNGRHGHSKTGHFLVQTVLYIKKKKIFLKRSRLVQTIQILDVKTSGFRMNLYLDWSDFGSPLYYTTYQALQLFCPVTKRWSLTLANIYHKVYDVSRLWNSPITQYRAWIESWMSLPFNRSSVVW